MNRRGRGQAVGEPQRRGRPQGRAGVAGQFAPGNRGGRNGPGVERNPRNNQIVEIIKNNLFNALKHVCQIDLRRLGHEEANFARRLRALGRGKFNQMEGAPADFIIRGQQEIMNLHEFGVAVEQDMTDRMVDPVIYKIAKRVNYVVDNAENIAMISAFLEQDHITASGNRAENLIEVNGEQVLKRVLKSTIVDTFDKFIVERGAEEICISSFRYIISKHLKHICLPSKRMLAECECRYCFDNLNIFNAAIRSEIFNAENGNMDLDQFYKIGFCDPPTIWCFQNRCDICCKNRRAEAFVGQQVEAYVNPEADQNEVVEFTHYNSGSKTRELCQMSGREFIDFLKVYMFKGLNLSGSGPKPGSHLYKIQYANKDCFNQISMLEEGEILCWFDHANGIKKQYGAMLQDEFYDQAVFPMQTIKIWGVHRGRKIKADFYNIAESHQNREKTAAYTCDSLRWALGEAIQVLNPRKIRLVCDGSEAQNWNATVMHDLRNIAREVDVCIIQKTTAGHSKSPVDASHAIVKKEIRDEINRMGHQRLQNEGFRNAREVVAFINQTRNFANVNVPPDRHGFTLKHRKARQVDLYNRPVKMKSRVGLRMFMQIDLKGEEDEDEDERILYGRNGPCGCLFIDNRAVSCLRGQGEEECSEWHPIKFDPA